MWGRIVSSEPSSEIEEEVQILPAKKKRVFIADESSNEVSVIAEVVTEEPLSDLRRSIRKGLMEAKRNEDSPIESLSDDDDIVGHQKERHQPVRSTRQASEEKNKKRFVVESSESEDSEVQVETRRSGRNVEKKNYREYVDDEGNFKRRRRDEPEGSNGRNKKHRTNKFFQGFGNDSDFVVQVDSELSSGEDYYSDDEDDLEPQRKPEKKPKRIVEIKCKMCGVVGASLPCSYCNKFYHPTCVTPPSSSKWKCPYCKCERLERVKSILTWRVTREEEEDKREFFVHYHDKSFWHCQWIPEFQLKVWQPILLRCYYDKHGRKAPPDLDDGDARRLRKNKEDPLELRFYQFGIQPDWLRIHRVISDKYEGGIKRYFVKWQSLGYEWCTWEDRETCEEILEEFLVAVEKYKEWQNYFCSKNSNNSSFNFKHVTLPPKRPTSDLNKKLEVQPGFIAKGLQLHEYQLEGLNWLRHSWANGVNTILADEMGLGKTIQTIIFLSCLYREGHSKGPFLISAPLSTVINWEREFELWAPELYVVVYTGADREARRTIRQLEFPSDPSTKVTLQSHALKCAPKFHVLLTSYEYVTLDKPSLSSIPWSMIVIDEAHRLKNDASLFFKTLTDYSTSYKLLLTGTPLQNNLEELFNLLSFLSPQKFHDMEEFTTEFQDIGKEEQVQKLHRLLGPHLLRRLKSDVLKDMPAKYELMVRVELSVMQKKLSKLILTKNLKALNAKGGRQTSLINIMMDLKKCCNHPYLFSTAAMEAPETPEGLFEVEALTNASGKMKVMRKMLKVLKEQGHRVLVFSQMTTMMDIIEEFLVGEGYAYERVDGRTKGPVRQDAIDRFNAPGAEQFVFLLSTKAGGLGINLATADTVIIYDSDWNPHNDIQALSRAHRIGQKSKVMIYRFVTRNSVEEKIAQVCKEKLMLTHLVVRPGIGKKLFSTNELESILQFGTLQLFDKDNDRDREIHYTDAAIEALLDRTQGDEVTEEEKEEETWINDYFSSFKVANYDVEAGAPPNEHPGSVKVEEDQEGNGDLENHDPDPNFWKSLINQQIEKEKQVVLASYGKGMRQRKQISYFETERPLTKQSFSAGSEGVQAKSPDYTPASGVDLDSSESSSSEEEFVPNQLHYLSSQPKRVLPYQPKGLSATPASIGDLLYESVTSSSNKRFPVAGVSATSNTFRPSEGNNEDSSSSSSSPALSLPVADVKGKGRFSNNKNFNNTKSEKTITRKIYEVVSLPSSDSEDSSDSGSGIEEIELIEL